MKDVQSATLLGQSIFSITARTILNNTATYSTKFPPSLGRSPPELILATNVHKVELCTSRYALLIRPVQINPRNMPYSSLFDMLRPSPYISSRTQWLFTPHRFLQSFHENYLVTSSPITFFSKLFKTFAHKWLLVLSDFTTVNYPLLHHRPHRKQPHRDESEKKNSFSVHQSTYISACNFASI